MRYFLIILLISNYCFSQRGQEMIIASYAQTQSVTFSDPVNVNSRVNRGIDDADTEIADGSTTSSNISSSDLELGYNTDDTPFGFVRGGLMFNSLNIPQGAIIENAYIEFTVDEVDPGTGSPTITFYGEDVDTPVDFTGGASNLLNRTKTTANTVWNNIPAWTVVGQSGPNQQTPDLSGILQEIVDRAGYTSASRIAIIYESSGNQVVKIAESYNAGASLAPIIYVTYKTIL